MTDGYDNQWSQKQILDVTAELSNHVDNSVFVEFGWGCNRALMSKMAEVSGGSLLLASVLNNMKSCSIKRLVVRSMAVKRFS